MELLLATTNVHKIREFRQLLKQLAPHLDIVSLHHFPNYEAPEENGTTFEDNARLKAIHAAHHLQRWTLADDSGLVVPALQGAPGVYSRRYAGLDASDADNRRKLLEAMNHLHDLERSAYYHCTLALAQPDGSCRTIQGQCEGYIAYSEKGRHGFGYDALFIKHDYDKSFAELDESIKNRMSHRAKAMEKLSVLLHSLRD